MDSWEIDSDGEHDEEQERDDEVRTESLRLYNADVFQS